MKRTWSREFTIAWLIATLASACVLGFGSSAFAQPPNIRYGEVVPRDVREIYDRGLQFLANSQSESGEWASGQTGPGVNGMALMVLLAGR